MSLERLRERYEAYQNAIQRLEEVVNEDIEKKGSIVVDATIKRFEFTFELSWKLLKDILEYNNVKLVFTAPRPIIKEAFQKKMIRHGMNWMEMLDARNKTTHLYDQEKSLDVYSEIKNNYFFLLKDLAEEAHKFFPLEEKDNS